MQLSLLLCSLVLYSLLCLFVFRYPQVSSLFGMYISVFSCKRISLYFSSFIVVCSSFSLFLVIQLSLYLCFVVSLSLYLCILPTRCLYIGIFLQVVHGFFHQSINSLCVSCLFALFIFSYLYVSLFIFIQVSIFLLSSAREVIRELCIYCLSSFLSD